jgi:hypothetical protein
LRQLTAEYSFARLHALINKTVPLCARPLDHASIHDSSLTLPLPHALPLLHTVRCDRGQSGQATPRGIPWDNSRYHVPTTGVFNDEKQIHGQTRVEHGGVRSAEGGDRRLHCSDAAADVWQAVCSTPIEHWGVAACASEACGGGDHQRREAPFVFRATHATHARLTRGRRVERVTVRQPLFTSSVERSTRRHQIDLVQQRAAAHAGGLPRCVGNTALHPAREGPHG